LERTTGSLPATKTQEYMYGNDIKTNKLIWEEFENKLNKLDRRIYKNNDKWMIYRIFYIYLIN